MMKKPRSKKQTGFTILLFLVIGVATIILSLAMITDPRYRGSSDYLLAIIGIIAGAALVILFAFGLYALIKTK